MRGHSKLPRGGGRPTGSFEGADDDRTHGFSKVVDLKRKTIGVDTAGPKGAERKLVDKGSLTLFFLLVGSTIALAVGSLSAGPVDVDNLAKVYDYDNRVCGTDAVHKDAAAMLWWPQYEAIFPDPNQQYTPVCTAECPLMGEVVCLNEDGYVTIIVVEDGEDSELDSNCIKVLYWQSSTSQRFGRCFTQVTQCDSEALQHETQELHAISALDITTKFVQDVWYSRWILIACGCVLPVFASWTLMKWATKLREAQGTFRTALPLAMLTMAVSSLPFLALQVLKQNVPQGFFECFYIDRYLLSGIDYITIGFMGVAFLFVMSLAMMKHHLRISSTLATETSRYLRSIKGGRGIVLTSSLMSSMLALQWFGFVIYVFGWAARLEERGTIYPVVRTIIAIGFSLGWLWLVSFSNAVVRITVAGSVSDFYWQPKRKKEPKDLLKESLRRTLRSHLGTAAKGSMLIPLLSWWRFLRSSVAFAKMLYRGCRDNSSGLIKRIFRRTKVNPESNSGINQWISEAIISAGAHEQVYVISRHAYTRVALYGGTLYEAGQFAFDLLDRNAYRVGKCYEPMTLLSMIASYLVLLVCLCVTLVCDVNLSSIAGFGKGRETPLPMVLCIMLSAFVAVHGALTPFDQAAKTLVYCFCEDLEKNDGTVLQPYHAPEGLMKLVGEEHRQAFNLTEPVKITADAVVAKKRGIWSRVKGCFGACKPRHVFAKLKSWFKWKRKDNEQVVST